MNKDFIVNFLLGSLIAICVLFLTACGSNKNEGPTNTVTFNDTLDCSNIENTLVDGLPPFLGTMPATPENTQKGIINYRELALKNDQNSAFYSSNADIMENRLNLFNQRVIQECQ